MRATRFNNLTKHTPFSLQLSSSYCSGGAGRGRGRGRGGVGSGSSPFDHFGPTKIIGQPTTESKPESAPSQNQGRSSPLPPPSTERPTFSSLISTVKSTKIIGQPTTESKPESAPSQNQGRSPPLKTRSRLLNPMTRPIHSPKTNPEVPSLPSTELPTFSSFISTVKSGGAGRGRGHVTPGSEPSQTTDSRKPLRINIGTGLSTKSTQPTERKLPSSVLSVLSGAGRGKPGSQPSPSPPPIVEEENRHLRVEKQGRGEDGAEEEGGERERGRGDRRFRRGLEDKDEGFGAGLYLGDNADGEKMAEKIGVENMNKLVEGFEEMSGRVLPSPIDDEYLDAFHTNCLFEFEPEYLVEFENPDIDEKPPIPLRDALEKMKPFLMAYEGIQSHEEWEEAVNEVMERVPLLKEIVDDYGGPDRVTAKQQQEELERVAKTVPDSAPASVKRFANRAVLSLQVSISVGNLANGF
ncbi:hypothetical protein Pint_36268 [Pistacia integerrima]|uniref:Uncharacterized protein n=1 Tax=Pistacia integerrima TaxID=434235 RepID=A0ACC0XZC7_9ROSI|nr:hypothetical protein Pint_36268 [Pistacia integerrima]